MVARRCGAGLAAGDGGCRFWAVGGGAGVVKRGMQSQPILQDRLPYLPWMDPRLSRLPGILPVEGGDWLRVDEAYGAQMALRDRLIADRRGAVHALLPEAAVAAGELLAVVLARLAGVPGYALRRGVMTRPDGVEVVVDPGLPLVTLGHLVQEDLCLMQPVVDAYVLTGAVLCFPASWTLTQKIGRPLLGIHHGVQPYTEEIARRVQRLFEAIRPEQPLWRMNYLTYDDFSLFQPRLEGQKRPRPVEHKFIRCERQCLLRLPVSRAVVFSIHSYLVAAERFTAAELAALTLALH